MKVRKEKEREASSKSKNKNEKGNKDENDDSLESLLEAQSRNQVRSDYRRSLGSENRRRYME